jgi:hypothetical protein
MQFVHEEAAAAEYLPVPQIMHSELPDEFLYFPASHAQQPGGNPSRKVPENPALQIQSLIVVLKMGEFEYAGHDVHVEEPNAE